MRQEQARLRQERGGREAGASADVQRRPCSPAVLVCDDSGPGSTDVLQLRRAQDPATPVTHVSQRIMAGSSQPGRFMPFSPHPADGLATSPPVAGTLSSNLLLVAHTPLIGRETPSIAICRPSCSRKTAAPHFYPPVSRCPPFPARSWPRCSRPLMASGMYVGPRRPVLLLLTACRFVRTHQHTSTQHARHTPTYPRIQAF